MPVDWANIAQTLGAAPLQRRPVAGGDICQAFQVTLEDGRVVFVKALADAHAAHFVLEASGLQWLTVPDGPAVPEPLAFGPGYLVLPWIPVGASTPQAEAQLGRQLAALHRHIEPGPGWKFNNFLGRLWQDNRPSDRWIDFYRERRLLRYAREAELPVGLRRRLEALAAGLEEHIPSEVPCSRLHGDLWGGNALVDTAGTPWIIDPAACAGDREVDLAMMRLFGGFSARTFAAYEEAWPLPAGAQARVPLYQLYYLLAHVRLFGASYLPAVERALSALGR